MRDLVVSFLYTILFVYLAALCLHWWARAFSDCSQFLWLQFLFLWPSQTQLTGSQFLAAVRGLLIAVASLVEHRLQGTQTSVVVAHRLGCSVACGIFLDQGLNPCLLHWQVYFSPLSYQGSPGMRWFLAGVGNWAVLCIEGGLTVASLHPREASRTPCMRPMSADTLCAPDCSISSQRRGLGTSRWCGCQPTLRRCVPLCRLETCELSPASCEDLASALTACTSLTCVNLEWISLDYDGAAVLCEALVSLECSLQVLGWVDAVPSVVSDPRGRWDHCRFVQSWHHWHLGWRLFAGGGCPVHHRMLVKHLWSRPTLSVPWGTSFETWWPEIQTLGTSWWPGD